MPERTEGEWLSGEFKGLNFDAERTEGEFCRVFERRVPFGVLSILDELLTAPLVESAGLLFHLVGVIGFLSVSINDNSDPFSEPPPKISASTAS